MRAAAFAVLLFLLLLCACGYVGPIVPPSPEIPNPVSNLGVIERGDQIAITFDTPPRTTDDLAIKRFSEIDLRIGPSPAPFDLNRWAASARQYEIPVPPANNPDDPLPRPMAKTLSASDWIGQRVAVLVRTAVKKNDHFSQWSNRVVLQVIPPLKPPDVEAKAVKQGFMLTWAPEASGLHYEIFRRGPTDKTPVQVATADAPPYVDTTSKWDTPYIYTVVAREDLAESLPSKPVSVESANIFPPEIPASITALAAPDSVEVSWSRSPDADLKGYYVYRSTDGGPFQRIGDLLNLPTFSDHNVQHGHTYRYEVSAVGQNTKESEKSAAAEANY